ncbi:MAG: 4Fe-4S dicluster domain-containing protein [Deltaproteobacteria bacterium]|nr:4Fe-4S dicluster domain-containing protein [Deltaproteobacteria bacterium]
MGVDRRKFLKILGISAAALGAKSAIDLVSDYDLPARAAEEAKPGFSLGKHWAMVVDIGKLTEEDCRAASLACHATHNVPDIRTPDGQVDKLHEIKWVWSDTYDHVFPDQLAEYVRHDVQDKNILVMCNHCTNPPCVRVCPTRATYKRPDGIVVMDMHRCIGCRFCMAGCPYGSRSFNWGDPRQFINLKKTNPAYPTRMKGVVEKCNFCEERLAKGLRPACVEACKSGALVFGDLESPSSEVRVLIREHQAIRRNPSLGTGPNVYYIV